MAVQWAHLGAGTVLVANDRGAWIQRPQLGALAIRGPMAESGPATVATTRHLLDGAIAAGERGADLRQPVSPTPARWAWHLVSQWYCAHHSVALLPLAIERFSELWRTDLVAFAQRKLDDEEGHDELASCDLEALGYDAPAAVAGLAPAPHVAAAVEYARELLTGEAPVAFLGYVYALERRVLLVSEESLSELEAALPAGATATSFVRAHATLLDVGHVEEAVTFIAGLSAADRTGITVAVYRTTEILSSAGSDQTPTDAELEIRLSRFHKETSGEPSP